MCTDLYCIIIHQTFSDLFIFSVVTNWSSELSDPIFVTFMSPKVISSPSFGQYTSVSYKHSRKYNLIIEYKLLGIIQRNDQFLNYFYCHMCSWSLSKMNK